MGLIRTDLPVPRAWPPPRERDDVRGALRAVRRRDPVGHQVHGVLATLYVLTLPLATMPSSLTFVLLLGYTLLRLPNTWRCYPALLRVPVLWAFVAYVGWCGVSIAWSDAPAQGWDELRAARVVLTPALLWPVLDRLPWLLGAALLGVLGQNLVQLAQGLHWLGLQPNAEGRLHGLMHPIQVGAWCTAALAWHLSAALTGRGVLRWAALPGLATAAVGLVATGSRGPWISAAISLPLCLLVIAGRRPAARWPALLLLVFGVVSSAAAWPTARRMVVPRVERAWAELDGALARGEYGSSVGLRIGLWSWAWTIHRSAPVLGTGAGSYQDELWRIERYRTLLDEHRHDEVMTDWLTRDHAHSTLLHTLAGSGLVGVVLLLALLVLALHRAWLDPPDHPWSAGTVFALVGWAVGAQFDCYHLNGHLYGLFALMVAVTLPLRPSLRWRWSESADGEEEPADDERSSGADA